MPEVPTGSRSRRYGTPVGHAGRYGSPLADEFGGGVESYLLGDATRRLSRPRTENQVMGQPVVHFEIIGADPQGLRSFYGDLFQWEFDTSGPVAEVVSEAGNYGFETALSEAERLGGTRLLGPEKNPGSDLVIGTSVTPKAT